jgi:serine/threonine-protein kinase
VAERYRIERELGAGGMATVYLAEDLKHHRKVAIKVLHAELSAVLGPERFLKEIELTASLQHPHILPLFDSGSADGLLYYVMPYVEGETLRARLERETQLPIADAVCIATEAADALDYAHRRGVVHRDIKPENILLHDGHALVADFGIALAVEQAGGARMTQTGLSLGTPQYMSPEQAMGERAIDARTDIYALGAVMYEMLAGVPPFTGPNVQAIVAQVLTEEPRSLIALRKSVPRHIESAVFTALEKLPADRFASAAELARALADSSAHAARAPGSPRRGHGNGSRFRSAILAAALVLAGALALLGWLRPRAEAERFATVLSVSMPAGVAPVGAPAISPDGRLIAFTGSDSTTTMLYVRGLGTATVRALRNTEMARNPFFAPDGRTIAFAAHGALWTVGIDGGTPEQIPGTNDGSVDPAGGIVGGDWGEDGLIRYSPSYRFQGILSIPAGGGTPEIVVAPDSVAGQGRLTQPQLLPGGKFLLCIVDGSGGRRIGVVSPAARRAHTIGPQGVETARYVAGRIVYVTTEGAAFAVPFDPAGGGFTGQAVRLSGLDGMNARLSLSRNGTVAYLIGDLPAYRLMSVSRGGHAIPLDRSPQWYDVPVLSPDGSRVAVGVYSAALTRDVWIFDVARRDLLRFTFEGGSDYPVWSRGGRRIAYTTSMHGSLAIVAAGLDDARKTDTLVSGVPYHLPGGWAHDDSMRVYRQNDAATNEDIYAMRLADRTTRAIANTPFTEIQPVLSPDDRWVAFVSNETGRREVYIAPADGSGGKLLASIGGGDEPRWARDGQSLYYRGADSLYTVSFDAAASPTVGQPKALFADHFARNSRFPDYDVFPGDTGFVMLQRAPSGPTRLRVVLNWQALLSTSGAQ